MDWLRAFLDFSAWGGGHLPGVTSRKPRTVLSALTRIRRAQSDLDCDRAAGSDRADGAWVGCLDRAVGVGPTEQSVVRRPISRVHGHGQDAVRRPSGRGRRSVRARRLRLRLPRPVASRR